MAASASDKFKKLSRKWVGQIGAAGVADASVTTVPLSSATNLPTDTGVVAVIDRVDSSGTKTPSLEETVIGVVSGSNLTSCTRGAEGTAQAHSAGAVVEILVTAKGWNDIVDGILAEHSQAGAHTAASLTAAGTVEIATAAETTTGTDATRAVSPDGLAGSVYGKRVVYLKNVVAEATALTTGDGKMYFIVPAELNGYNLIDADAAVNTVSSSGTPTVMVYNVTDSQDMLSVGVTIDANELTSYTAATGPTINTTYDDVATGDQLRIDVDVAGTGTKGLDVILVFQLP